jgi:hypothetical protein
MALLRRYGEVRAITESELLVGRASSSGWQMRFAYVSAQHAVLRWSEQRWSVKDLGSRNGTYVDGSRLAPGVFWPIARGARLSFGSSDEGWELIDAGPPGRVVVPLDGGPPLVIEGNLLAIPEARGTFATLYQDCLGQWQLEQPGEPGLALFDGTVFSVRGRSYRFCCPEADRTAPLAVEARPPARFHFTVSRDEEHVTLQLVSGQRTVDLGSRSHNYLLLTLARARLRDDAGGLPASEAGWMYLDELASGLRVSPNQLNVDIFRIRQHLARAGAAELVNAIERRPRAKQMRIGTPHLTVEGCNRL